MDSIDSEERDMPSFYYHIATTQKKHPYKIRVNNRYLTIRSVKERIDTTFFTINGHKWNSLRQAKKLYKYLVLLYGLEFRSSTPSQSDRDEFACRIFSHKSIISIKYSFGVVVVMNAGNVLIASDGIFIFHCCSHASSEKVETRERDRSVLPCYKQIGILRIFSWNCPFLLCLSPANFHIIIHPVSIALFLGILPFFSITAAIGISSIVICVSVVANTVCFVVCHNAGSLHFHSPVLEPDFHLLEKI